MSFAATYDRTTRILSALVCLGLATAAVASHSRFVAFLSAAVIILGYAYSPRGYVVAGRAILVKRLIGNIRVPLENLREARPATPEDLRFCVRLWGSGGFFGYYGLFRTTRLGKCTWYVTDRSRTIVVVTESKTTLYSPDDTEAFLAAIRG